MQCIFKMNSTPVSFNNADTVDVPSIRVYCQYVGTDRMLSAKPRQTQTQTQRREFLCRGDTSTL